MIKRRTFEDFVLNYFEDELNDKSRMNSYLKPRCPLINDSFKNYLWEDIVKATGYYSAHPKGRTSFWTYTINLLKNYKPIIAIDSSSPQIGDLVLMNGYDSADFPNNMAIGVLKSVEENEYRGYSIDTFLVSGCYVRDIDRHGSGGLFKLRGVQSLGDEINAGDKVLINSLDCYVLRYVEPSKSEIPYKVYGTIEIPASSPNNNLAIGKEYFVMSTLKKKKRLRIWSGKNIIELPARVVSKVPGCEPIDLQSIVRDVVIEFYNRKGIYRKVGMFRQLLAREAKLDKEGLLKGILGQYFGEYITGCRVVKHVR